MQKRMFKIICISGTVVLAAILGVMIWILVGLYSRTDAVFADGTTINGHDVSGLTADETETLFQELAESYSLQVGLDGLGTTVVTAEDISLSLAEELPFAGLLNAQQTAWKELAEGESLSEDQLTLTAEGLVTYDTAVLSTLLESVQVETNGGDAVNATLSYDESAEKYVIIPEEYGGTFDAAVLQTAVEEALGSLSDELAMDSVVEVPDILAQDVALQQALTDANGYLDVELTYTFAAKNGQENITRAQIASWLTYDEESITVTISNEALQAYVTELVDTYSVSNNTSKFKTVSGSYITVKVSSAGETVNGDALYNDIYDCLTGGISGTRQAPYDTSSVTGDVVDFGGNYVEVDLTNQHLYVFVDGTQVMDSDIVSGKVSAGCATPTGVYTIKAKQTDRYLTGETYRSWVNYWMPFNGGIGFHDATWRSSFGGTIYQYSGSHGCINMPLANAKKLYGYVSVGTYVVVYGGVSSVPTKTQTVTVTSSYSKMVGDAAFSLDAATSGDGELTYVSSNTSVATVDSSGKVTVVGVGTATITVTAAATATYKEATATTTITVSAHQHSYALTGRKAATCTEAGSETYTCSTCGSAYTKTLDPLGHSHAVSGSEWSEDNENCTIVITCSRCGDSRELTAVVTSQVTKEATETEAGECVYTAVADYDGKTYSATKTVEIPAKGTDSDSDSYPGKSEGTGG